MELNDETLGAYLDGELSDRQRAAVDAALAGDGGARLRLQRLRDADAQLKAAFPLIPTAGNDPLAAAILAHQPGQPLKLPTRADIHVLRSGQPRIAARWYRRPAWRGALAASFAAALVGLLTLNHSSERQPSVDAALVAALDQTPSGSEARDGDRSTRMVLSFQAADGRWCRVFDQDHGAHEGLACNGDDGWQVLALEVGNGGADGLRPAGSNPAIDTLMDRLGGGDAISADVEHAQIARRWNRSSPR